jgi:hypothetical protein
LFQIVIVRILDLSIRKYFDSLKEIFQKEILSLRAKGSGNFEGTIKNRIQRRQRRRFKIAEAVRPESIVSGTDIIKQMENSTE